MNNQSRWKSKTAWMTVVTLIAFVLNTYFHIVIPELDTLINLMFTVLIGFGIWNNPRDGDRF